MKVLNGRMTCDIYLDIDGVLLANEENPALYASEFLRYVLTQFPDSTYWLTTHCRGDASVPVARIAGFFELELLDMMRKIKPTNWETAKTEAIDFSRPFLWFDDDCFDDERQTLLAHGVLENWIEVDLRKDPAHLKRFIESLPLPISPSAVRNTDG